MEAVAAEDTTLIETFKGPTQTDMTLMETDVQGTNGNGVAASTGNTDVSDVNKKPEQKPLLHSYQYQKFPNNFQRCKKWR